MPSYPSEIEYSDKYQDGVYEYKNVTLTKELFKKKPKGLLSEEQWRQLGVVQTRGWVHFAIHKPEPHVLMFKRPLGMDLETLIIPSEVKKTMAEYSLKRKRWYGKVHVSEDDDDE